MRKKFLFLFFMLYSCLVFAQGEYILFGSGGGITGQVSAYKIYTNGKVLKGKGKLEITYSETGKIKKKEARQIFKDVSKTLNTPFSHPGDMYYFIQKVSEGSDQKYTWGSADYEVSEAIGNIYNSVMKKLSSTSYKQLE
jgi:hypothetical protein